MIILVGCKALQNLEADAAAVRHDHDAYLGDGEHVVAHARSGRTRRQKSIIKPIAIGIRRCDRIKRILDAVSPSTRQNNANAGVEGSD